MGETMMDPRCPTCQFGERHGEAWLCEGSGCGYPPASPCEEFKARDVTGWTEADIARAFGLHAPARDITYDDIIDLMHQLPDSDPHRD